MAVTEFVGDETGHVRAIRICEVEVKRVDGRRVVSPVPGTSRELPADLVTEHARTIMAGTPADIARIAAEHGLEA